MSPNDISSCRNIDNDMVQRLRMFADRTAIIPILGIIEVSHTLAGGKGESEQ